jgi:hypothetical protein
MENCSYGAFDAHPKKVESSGKDDARYIFAVFGDSISLRKTLSETLDLILLK